jgi:membrane protease YdiL (CAAX protease family)
MKAHITTAAGQTLPTPSAAARPVLLYFGAAFAFTWLVLGLAVLAGHGVIALPIPATVLITLGTLGPLLAAVSVTAAEAGRTGVRRLLGQLRHWRAHPRWYAVALLGLAMGMVLAFLFSLALGGPLLPAPPLMAWLSVPILVVALIIPALCEEVGWRGYALPRLQERFGALGASVILGIIWACWHLPIWFIPGAGFEQQPFGVFVLMTTAYSILFTWLYNSTGRRLPVVILAHAVIDSAFLPWGAALSLLPTAARGIVPQIPISLAFALLALLVVLFTTPHTLTRRPAWAASPR